MAGGYEKNMHTILSNGLKLFDAYYQDVYVWLPDIHWEDCMLCCPSCRSNEDVINHGFHENHFGRVIVGMKET
ncbi:LOW QUALITY PROTEIN: hypothetical protein ACHAW6_015275 [Cyclotella cf. meneghiniana]